MQMHADNQYRCFLALPQRPIMEPVRVAVARASQQAGYVVVSLDRELSPLSTTIQESLIGEIAKSDCVIADVTSRNSNVFFELGLAQAMGKGVLLIAEFDAVEGVPFDLRGFRVLGYERSRAGMDKLARDVEESLLDYKRFPSRSLLHPELGYSLPFFVDWDRLGPREMENLCRELLALLGFQRIEWAKTAPEIDLVAQLPKKDPDGFEYSELWFITFGFQAPMELVVRLARDDPDYFFHRVLGSLQHRSRTDERVLENPITLLLVLVSENADELELRQLVERFERPRGSGQWPAPGLRVRIWDRSYIASLIRRFPQIGYKYFSDEVRIRSQSRKSYEELYKENLSLVSRQTNLIKQLEDEKNKRIRAERDSVWRDISFSAAHKIGNPLFAIETDLDPLHKRIKEGRVIEAEDVIVNIRSALEKAKTFIEQFKSLAKAQQMTPVPTTLYPLMEDACRSAKKRGVSCRIECAKSLSVLADPERLGECFDELVANALHWLIKSSKQITMKAEAADAGSLPDFVDSSRSYVFIQVSDNGPGIALSQKERVFDAFFTTHDQGTGLGLALVRRVIDGLGGSIRESGRPSHGALFEIYLPVAELTGNGRKSKRKKP